MSEHQTLLKPKPVNGDKIDPIAIAKMIWNGRKTLILSVITGAIIGLIVALISPTEYTASTMMVPQVGNDSQSKLGGLGGLAALAGINIDLNQGAELSPMIYPQIVSSIPFQLELMNTTLNFQDLTAPITLLDYYTKYRKTSVLGSIMKYSIGLPRLVMKAIRGKPKALVIPGKNSNQLIILTEDQYIVEQIMDDLVKLDVNAKQGYLTLTIQMPEALAAAQLAQKAQILMQSYITEFKVEKAKANLNFIQERYNETKTEFEKAQVSLAVVNDRNKNFTSGLSQIEADRIQTRFTFALNVFQELAKQLEQAKIQVKKETPIFTIIQPVTVPIEKSKPNRPKILIICLLLGAIFGIGIVFGKEYVTTIKELWNE